MTKLRCLLSGGHRYHPSKVVTTHDDVRHVIVLHNFCVKCSHMIAFEMPSEVIDNEIKKAQTREWFKWSYGEEKND